MQLTPEQYQTIRDHTLSEYPKEAVIAITPTKAIPMENIHPEPNDHFRVSSQEFYKLKATALIHSHTVVLGHPRPEFEGRYYDHRIPSKADMVAQQNMDIPFGIVSTDGKEVSDVLWFPDLESPLEGRDYIPSVYDCMRLIRAYYWQNHGIYINDYPRDLKWWKTDPMLYINNFQREGFYEIAPNEMLPGDALIIRLVGDHESHAGVYLGNDTYIDHVTDKLSGPQNLSRNWSRVTRILRHKGVNQHASK